MVYDVHIEPTSLVKPTVQDPDRPPVRSARKAPEQMQICTSSCRMHSRQRSHPDGWLSLHRITSQQQQQLSLPTTISSTTTTTTIFEHPRSQPLQKLLLNLCTRRRSHIASMYAREALERSDRRTLRPSHAYVQLQAHICTILT
jgi:hypothetical protein